MLLVREQWAQVTHDTVPEHSLSLSVSSVAGTSCFPAHRNTGQHCNSVGPFLTVKSTKNEHKNETRETCPEQSTWWTLYGIEAKGGAALRWTSAGNVHISSVTTSAVWHVPTDNHKGGRRVAFGSQVHVDEQVEFVNIESAHVDQLYFTFLILFSVFFKKLFLSL